MDPVRDSRRKPLSPTTFVVLVLLAAMAVGVATMVLIHPSPEDEEDRAPVEVSFEVNETRDHARVNATQENLTWDLFQVKMDRAGAFLVVGDENVTRGEPLVFTRIDNESVIQEGDRLRFCLNQGDEPLEVHVRHTATGFIVDTFRIASVAPCDQGEPDPVDEEDGQSDESEGDDEDDEEDETGTAGESGEQAQDQGEPADASG